MIMIEQRADQSTLVKLEHLGNNHKIQNVVYTSKAWKDDETGY